MAELETVTSKRTVEAMVTAILAGNGRAQELVVTKHGLTPREERYVRSGASIIAGMIRALAKQTGRSAVDLWQMQLEATEESRLSRRSAFDGETQHGA